MLLLLLFVVLLRGCKTPLLKHFLSHSSRSLLLDIKTKYCTHYRETYEREREGEKERERERERDRERETERVNEREQ